MEKRAAIKKYFTPFPKWAIGAAAIGALMVFGGFAGSSTSWGTAVVGLLLVAAGVMVIVNWTKRPTDAEMDAYIAEDIATAGKRALVKAGVEESDLVAESVAVTGPRIWDTGGASVKWAVGKDKMARFTPINVTVLSFSPNQLISYQCAMDLFTGNSLNESTDEYFYKDVVSVSTKTVSVTKNSADKKVGQLQLNAAETFTLTTSGGTSIEVILKDPKIVDMMGGDIPTTLAEKAIQSVRKMLREKKAA